MAEINQWLAERPSLRGPGKKKVKGSRKNKKWQFNHLIMLFKNSI